MWAATSSAAEVFVKGIASGTKPPSFPPAHWAAAPAPPGAAALLFQSVGSVALA